MTLKLSASRIFYGFLSKSEHVTRNYSSNNKGHYDIIICGGGLIGQTVACALSKNTVLSEYSVLLIQESRQKPFVDSKSYSNRVSAIVPSSQKLLDRLGIWQNIKRYHVVNDMKVWGYLSNDFVHFIHEIESPAYIIENDDIINATLIENKKAKNLKILTGSPIEEVSLKEGRIRKNRIKLKDGNLFETDLLIGSDGANSLIRKAMRTNYLSWDYEQCAVVATLFLSDNENENITAWQRFRPEGPIALLPLSPKISSLVWSTTQKSSKDLLGLSNEIFVDAINEAIQSKPSKNEIVDSISFCANSIINYVSSNKTRSVLTPPHIKSLAEGSRASFPLSFGHSSEYVKPGVALVGDAAHKIHPLAGQGVNIGFRDVKTLEEKVVAGILNGLPLGDFQMLRHYETECQRKNIPLMASIEFIHRVYTSRYDLVQAFGNVGFNFVNSLSSVKNILKQAATT